MNPLLPANWPELDAHVIGRLAPVQWLDWQPFSERGLQLGIKREDLLHPDWGGNKVYKLHGHLRAARALGQRHLLSFGGPWSNHIHALAAIGRAQGMHTTGIIRGERPRVLSPMLEDAEARGMRLRFVSRTEYSRKSSTDFIEILQRELGPFYHIPEGGGGPAGVAGSRALGQALGELAQREPFDLVCVPVGTGSTVAGLAAGLPANTSVCGFSVLRGEDRLSLEVKTQVESLGTGAHWWLETDYHGGGYARMPDALAAFIHEFEAATGIRLDPVYTAKMMWGITRKALAGHWRRGTRILAIHSGGLQGRRGFPSLGNSLIEARA